MLIALWPCAGSKSGFTKHAHPSLHNDLQETQSVVIEY